MPAKHLVMRLAIFILRTHGCECHHLTPTPVPQQCSDSSFLGAERKGNVWVMLSGKAQSEQAAFPEEAWLTCLEQHSLYQGRWPNSGTAHFCPPALHLLGPPRDKGHLTVQLLFLPGNSDKSTGTGRMGILIIVTDEDGPVGLSHHAPSHTQHTSVRWPGCP